MTIDSKYTRPRQSILSLFDPLSAIQGPSTPPRNHSPDADSDKENENPPARNDLTLTTFFNRTYKTHQPVSKPLRRRLIDIGDVTVDDADPWILSEEPNDQSPNIGNFEDNENDTLTFRKMAEAATPKWNANKPSKCSTPSPTAPRTPLADLSVDEDATPVARTKAYHRKPMSIPSKLAKVESPQIVVSGTESPQSKPPKQTAKVEADVDNEKNSAPSNIVQAGDQEILGLPIPRNPLINSVSSITLPSSSVSGSLLVDTVIPNAFSPSISLSDEAYTAPGQFDDARLCPDHLATSSTHQNRHSVDLQSSFQLHMGDEAEFDLLNDKISFFGASRHGTYMDDQSFEMSFGDSASAENSEEDFSPVTPKELTFQHQSKDTRSPEWTGPAKKADAVQAIAPSNSVKAATHPPQPAQESSSDFSTIRQAQPAETVTPKHSRDIISGPPPVIGLRIVKRTQLPVQKTLSKAVSSPKLAAIQSTVVKKSPGLPANAKPRESTLTRRNTNASQAATTGSSTRTWSGAPTAKPQLPTGPASRTSGPRRVPATDEPERRTAARPTVGGGSAALSHAGPRRVPISDRPSITKGSTSDSSSRQPYSTSSLSKAQLPIRTNTGSSLPQPIQRSSRLPAPSVAVRPTGIPAREPHRGIPIRRVH